MRRERTDVEIPNIYHPRFGDQRRRLIRLQRRHHHVVRLLSQSQSPTSPSRTSSETHRFRTPLLQNGLIAIDIRIDQFRYDILPQFPQESLRREITVQLLDPFRDFGSFRFGEEATDGRGDCSSGGDEWILRVGVGYSERGEKVGDGFRGEMGEAGSFRFVRCCVQ